MTAPPRPGYRETAREVAAAAGADFAGELFLAEVEKARRPGRRAIPPTLVGFGDPYARFSEIQAGAEARYREKLREWNRHAPQRRAAQAAFERANRRRAAELGMTEPVRIAAALDWAKPMPPRGIG